MSRRRATMTPAEIERARDQDRRRQARRRAREPGAVLVLLPPDVADELGDEEEVAARAIEILRHSLARGRDRA